LLILLLACFFACHCSEEYAKHRAGYDISKSSSLIVCRKQLTVSSTHRSQVKFVPQPDHEYLQGHLREERRPTYLVCGLAMMACLYGSFIVGVLEGYQVFESSAPF
jgi:hypothetical protein